MVINNDRSDKDFQLGYYDGLEAAEINSRDAFNAIRYYEGYIFGNHERCTETADMVPEWMTPEQAQAVKKLYRRSYDNSPTRAAFFKRVEFFDDYCGLGWCGMFIGIEKDGYTHS